MPMNQPLAAMLRPENLDSVVGQGCLVGTNAPLRLAIEKRQRFSFVLWGPPGTGKTTIARIYARSLDTQLFERSAVSATKEDIRTIITAAEATTLPTVLFLDEIHRFNKAQQDFLLPHVESGLLTLIGATTENPSFEVIPALLSRCRVFTLQPLSEDDLVTLIKRTKVDITPDAIAALVTKADGDARKLLGMVEAVSSLYGTVTVEGLAAAGGGRLRYDRAGEEHYDVTSAFIKSMRASQPSAALYYLARMVEGGEDPLFIARRMIVFASEDIGLAQPTALVVANAVFDAVNKIGMPEAAINLAHGVAYLAQSKKDRRAYDGLRSAQEAVRHTGNVVVPMRLRNAPTKLMKEQGYAEGYEMSGDDNCLPEQLQGRTFLQ